MANFSVFPCARRFALAVLVTAANSVAFAATEDVTGLAAFRRDVQPLLKQFCIECHGPDTQEGDLRLDKLNADLVNGPDAESWHDVLDKLNLGEMPPDDADALSSAQRQTIVGWLTRQLQRAVEVRRSTGGQVVLRRLTRYEYNNTMRDLLGVDIDYAQDLPPDSTSPEGFQNNGSTLGISPLQVELYLEAARRGLQQAIVVGERPEVFTHHADQSEKVRRVKGEVSNRLGKNERFLVRMNEFPREGEIAVRIRASAVGSDDAPYPRMRVALGVRADTRAPEKTLGEVDVVSAKPQTYELFGRIEKFPLPGHNPKFPGLQISIYNGFGDGADVKSKNKKNDGKGNGGSEESTILIESVEFEGPVLTSWPPPSHMQILIPSENMDDEAVYAREVLQHFLTRAYRRPASEADVTAMLSFFDRLRSAYATFAETMREALAMALISPDFLYLVEPRQQPAKREALSDYELASRLSYFLWSSMPDQRLFELARADKLRDPATLAGEVDRMLRDTKSREFVRHFTNQWLDLAATDRVAVNPEYHPDFDDALKADMRAETELFFAAILDDDLSCLQLLDADFTYVNRRLAKHYGLRGPRGTALERVALTPEDRRGGLLTQGSFLLANSNGEDSHPIKRAVWLLDRLLDNPPAPPPPDVPQLDPAQPDLAGLSLKEQLEVHRKKQSCNNCHRGIDPWGIAFENYDAVGRWRTEVVTIAKGQKRGVSPVDASVTLPDGATIAGVDAMKQYLLQEQKEAFAEALVKRLLVYSLGRSLDISDHATLSELTRNFVNDDYRLQKLITAIVQSDPFQNK